MALSGQKFIVKIVLRQQNNCLGQRNHCVIIKFNNCNNNFNFIEISGERKSKNKKKQLIITSKEIENDSDRLKNFY